jgi:hypothetical protein
VADADKAAPPGTDRQRWLRLAAGSLLSVILLVFALRGVPLAEVAAALGRLNWGWIVIGLLCVNAVNVAKAARWQALLRPHAGQIGLRRLFAVVMIGQAMNAFAPIRVGDVARAYMVPGVGVGAVLYTVVVEKALDSLALLAMLGGVAAAMPLPVWLKQSGIALSVALVAVLGALIAAGLGSRHILRAGRWLEDRFPILGRVSMARGIERAAGAVQSLSQAHVLAQVTGWTLVSWLLGAAANYVIFSALGLTVDRPWVAAAFLIVVLYLGAVVPSSPGRVGLFHYLAVISLALFGVAKAPALSYGIVLHIVVYGPTAVLGAYYIWRGSQGRT